MKKLKRTLKVSTSSGKWTCHYHGLSLLTIYKSFFRPHLDYGDRVYDQPNNFGLSDEIENGQYSAVVAITAANKGNLKEEILSRVRTVIFKE